MTDKAASNVDTIKKKEKLPRATLRQKIQVLDYINGPPVRTQVETLNYFKSLKQFSISQATLSSWTTNELNLRYEFNQNPNLESYKKKPVFKNPDITRQVENCINNLILNGELINNKLIKNVYSQILVKNGLSLNNDYKLSTGMLKSFKKRNSLSKKNLKITQNNNNQLDLQNNFLANSNDNILYQNDSTNLDLNFDDIFNNNNSIGFNTRLIHPNDIIPFDINDSRNNNLNVDLNLTNFLPVVNDQNNTNNVASNTNDNFTVNEQSVQNLNNQQIYSRPQNHLPDDPQQPMQVQNGNHHENINTNLSGQTQNDISLNKNESNTKVTTSLELTNNTNKRPLPYYPSYQNPINDNQYYKRQNIQFNSNFNSKLSNSNSEKIEKILENITNGNVTLYNSGTSAIMGILSYLNPKIVFIDNEGYKGTHDVIKFLNKLTNVKKLPLSELLNNTLTNEKAVIILESPMNPLGYIHDLSYYSSIAKSFEYCKLIVDSTLAPPPLQFPFDYGCDFIVYSAVKYLAGVSDLGAGFIVSRTTESKNDLHIERSALGTSIANFDSFLLVRNLRTYKMRILTQCNNTEKIINYLIKNFNKYNKVLKKIHHASLQVNKYIVMKQLNGFYNPVFALQLENSNYPKILLNKFNYLSNNPNLEGGETLVELIHDNNNFFNSSSNETDLNNENTYSNMLRFSVGCEDYQDIIKDIDQALMNLIISIDSQQQK